LWDMSAGKLVREISGYKGHGCRLTFYGEGDLLLSNDWDAILRVWEVSSGQQLISLPAGNYEFLTCSADGRLLALNRSNQRDLRLLRLHRSNVQWRIQRSALPESGYFPASTSHVFFADSRLLLCALRDSSGMAAIDVRSGWELARLDLPQSSPLICLASGPVLTRGSTGLLRWPVTSDAERRGRFRLGPPDLLLRTPLVDKWSCDAAGRVFAIPNYDEGAVCWCSDHPEHFVQLRPQRDVRMCAVSPDGVWIATATHDADVASGVKIWDAATGTLAKELPVPAGCDVDFSPDGRWLMTQGGGGQLWHVGTWQPAIAVGGPAARFSPDGQVLAVEAERGTVRLVDPENGMEFIRLQATDHDRVIPVSFSPDGTQLVTLSVVSAAFQVWDLRALRRELHELGLDWDALPFPEATDDPQKKPLQLDVDLGNPKDLQDQSDAHRLLHESYQHREAKRFGQAIEALRRAVEKDPNNAEADNSLAWFLLIGPKELRNPAEALPLARRAAKLCPYCDVFQNTLGVALYRNGQPDQAIPVLQRSLQKGDGKYDAFDLFPLALCHHQLGHADKAKQCYERALHWFEEHRKRLHPTHLEDLNELQKEAEAMLRK
jgi:WD40 repeat protein